MARRLRGEHRLEARIVGDRAARPLGHAERGELGVAELARSANSRVSVGLAPG